MLVFKQWFTFLKHAVLLHIVPTHILVLLTAEFDFTSFDFVKQWQKPEKTRDQSLGVDQILVLCNQGY